MPLSLTTLPCVVLTRVLFLQRRGGGIAGGLQNHRRLFCRSKTATCMPPLGILSHDAQGLDLCWHLCGVLGFPLMPLWIPLPRVAVVRQGHALMRSVPLPYL